MHEKIRRPPDDIDLEDEDTLPAEGDADDIPAVTPDDDLDDRD
jgi:hypothetical protein